MHKRRGGFAPRTRSIKPQAKHLYFTRMVPSAPITERRNDTIARETIDPDARYSRQVLFRPIGREGQQRLAEAHAVVVGVGATGAATAQLLARAGVGRLTIIDRDFVEPSNLQRQVLFDEGDARDTLPKAEAARRHLALINSDVQVTAHIADLVPANIAELTRGAHLLLDCTDNFETRYLLNDYSVSTATPWIYAAAVGSYAVTMNILPGGFRVQGLGFSGPGAPPTADRHPPTALNPNPSPLNPAPTACLACIFPAPPRGEVETCDTAGILSTAVNLAASLQTTEALKFLTGQPEKMRRTLLSWDLWSGERSELRAGAPDPACEVCGARRFRHLAGEARPHITLCGRNSVQIHEHARPLDLISLRNRLSPLGEVRANDMLLRFTYGEHTLTVFPDGRALIHGTTDPALARSLYARFIGS